MGSAIIPLSIDDEVASEEGCDVACMSTPYLISIGFSLIFSALFAKLLRVHKLFNNKSMRRIKVDAKDVMKPLVALLFLNIIILALWTGLSPLVWVREVTAVDDLGNPTESLGMCKSDGALPYAIVLVVVDLGAMVIALYQAYLCRSISLEFAESSYIASAIGCILLVSFVGIPVMIIASDQPQARFFVTTSIVFVICTSLLLFIFVPKEQFRRNKKDVRDSVRKVSKQQTASTMSRLSNSSSNSSHEGGLRILNNPQTVLALEQENAVLRRENSELKRRNSSTLEDTGKSLVDSNNDDEGNEAAATVAVTEN